MKIEKAGEQYFAFQRVAGKPLLAYGPDRLDVMKDMHVLIHQAVAEEKFRRHGLRVAV